MTKIISLLETKDSLNQSVFGVNLAIALANQSKDNVAFIDFSFSNKDEIEILLKYKPERSVLDMIEILPKLDEMFMRGFLPQHKYGVTFLGGVKNDKKYLVNPAYIQKIVNLMSKEYSTIFLTTPCEHNQHLLSILDSSDITLMTVIPNFLSIEYANAFLDTIKLWHLPFNLVKPVIINKSASSHLTKENIKQHIGLDIFSELTFEQDIVFRSINTGKPAVISNSLGNFSTDIKLLANKIIKLDVPTRIRRSEKTNSNPPIMKDIDNILSSSSKEYYVKLKNKIHQELLSKIDIKETDIKKSCNKEKFDALKDKTKKTIQELIAREDKLYSREERAEFVDELLNEVLGLGCLEKYLNDPEITEIMVNGPNKIYIEKNGKIHLTDSYFINEKQLNTIIDRIVSPIGRRVDESSPLVDARLSDGSRVNVVIHPVSLIGPSLTIRKFFKKKLLTEDLVNYGSLTNDMSEFLEACVLTRKNILISGGTGSGKTTLLNVLSSFIPKDDRIITIEDSAELMLPQDHVIRLETKPASVEGSGEISIRRLVINSLRMRPDRIIVGECRGGEALDMLQAMNTGHDGSLTTVHANSAKDAISRITTMVMMAGTELPDKAIKEQISSAIHIIVQLSRFSDGTRKITDISEVTGIENNTVQLRQIFKYEQTGVKNTKVLGRFMALGNLPTFLNQIETCGFNINKEIFNENINLYDVNV